MATYDLWLFNTDTEADLTGELELSFGDQAKKVRGVEKLVNMFVHIFLTEVASDLVYSDVGTQVATTIGGNIIYNRSFYESIVRLSIDDAVAIIKEDQDGSTPEDEYLLSAELLDFSILVDTMNVRVRLNTLAGSQDIVVPTSFSL